MLLSVEELKKLLPGAHMDRRGKNMYATCPKCNHDEFGISIFDNHQFGCFRKSQCGFTGNIFTLLAFLGKSVYDVKPGFAPKANIDVEKMFIHHDVPINLDLPDYKMPVGFKRINHHPYLESRGFTKADYERFGVGITDIDIRYRGFVIFTIKQFGAIKASIARSQKSKHEIDTLNSFYKLQGLNKKELRYRNSDCDFAKILLGVEEITEKTETVIIVEGLFDKQNTDRRLNLTVQDEVKCCATFKCGVSDEQMFLLQQTGVKQIVLLYDPDVIEEIQEAAWHLDSYFDVHVGFSDNGKDPGDMDEDDFDNAFATLKSPSQFKKVTVPKLKRK